MNNKSLLRNAVELFSNRAVRLFLAVFILLMTLAVFGSQSFITIELPKDTKDFTLTITPEDSKTSTTSLHIGSTYKKLVRTGTYEVLVSSGETSYYEIVRTGRFFASKKISTQLQPENSRRFVGNKPSACSAYAGGVLLSYNCQLEPIEAKVHVPATDKLPTYSYPRLTNKEGEGIEGESEGFAVTNEGILGLSKIPDEENVFGYHKLFKVSDIPGYLEHVETIKPEGIDDDPHGAEGILPGVDALKDYRIMSHDTGFALYDSTLSQVYVYKNTSEVKAKTEIKIPAPKDKNVKPFSISSHKNIIAAVFATEGKPRTYEIIVVGDGRVRTIKLTGLYTKIGLCSTDTLCASGTKTDIFDLRSGRAKKINSILATDHLSTNTETILLTTRQGVLIYNVNQKKGYLSISTGTNPFGSLQSSLNGYTIVSSPNTKQAAMLYVQTNTPNSDSIDKKVEKLLTYEGIESVSIYGSYIYVSPKLGDLVYDSESNSFKNNPETVNKSREILQKAIAENGLDTSKYTVINTAL